MKKLSTWILLIAAVGASKAQTLQTYINEGLENSPRLQAYALKYQIALEQVDEAGWVPNTEIAAGYFASEPETRTGAQRARLSARQMLPWFGTIGKRKGYARAQAETERVEYTVEQRKLALEISRSYYSLFGLQARRRVLGEQLRLLDTYEELALKAVEVDKAGAVDVLKLQIRRNELNQQQEVLSEQYRAEQTRFNGLLNRDPELPVQVVSEVDIPEQDSVEASALVVNPELLRFEALYESVMQAEQLNRKQAAPMLGLGLDYLPVEERPGLTFSDNGKDIVMPMVSLSIPLFNRQYASRSRQNELRRQELAYLKEERLIALQAVLAEAEAGRNQARIAFRTQEKNRDQVQNALEIQIRIYETGTIDFNELLELQNMDLRIRNQQLQAVQLYYEQSALINYLTAGK